MKIHWFAGIVTTILMGIMMWSASSDLPIHTKEMIWFPTVAIWFSLLGYDFHRKRKKRKESVAK